MSTNGFGHERWWGTGVAGMGLTLRPCLLVSVLMLLLLLLRMRADGSSDDRADETRRGCYCGDRLQWRTEDRKGR